MSQETWCGAVFSQAVVETSGIISHPDSSSSHPHNNRAVSGPSWGQRATGAPLTLSAYWDSSKWSLTHWLLSVFPILRGSADPPTWTSGTTLKFEIIQMKHPVPIHDKFWWRAAFNAAWSASHRVGNSKGVWFSEWGFDVVCSPLWTCSGLFGLSPWHKLASVVFWCRGRTLQGETLIKSWNERKSNCIRFAELFLVLLFQ